MLYQIQFAVLGRPRPQGSMKSFASKRTGKQIAISDNPHTMPWRQQVAGTALQFRNAHGLRMIPSGVPLSLQALFYFKRPKNISPLITKKTTKPDLDKLLRAIKDSLSGIIYEDDQQVVESHQSKEYGLPERVEIYLREISPKGEREWDFSAPKMEG